MNIHFIAIGGSIMHSLAIALKEAGHQVTGSDDRIYDPARSRLKEVDLLPADEGWNVDHIHSGLDAIILGMHAFDDNPELKLAQELNIPIYSFPEFIFQQSQNKHRIVIAGSYGKTTVTSLIMHVLAGVGIAFDYLVGAEVPGFKNSVKISKDAPILLVEGDEYLASKLDPRPKFLLYQAHIVLINGISWDHINVFPTEKIYNQQFEDLLKSMDKAADVIYNQDDKLLSRMVQKLTNDSHYLHAFSCPSYKVEDGRYKVKLAGEKKLVKLIGKHNMANIAAAWQVCSLLSVEIGDFLKHAATFAGAKSRMETVVENAAQVVIKDYAHAPAKVQATVEAVRERYAKENLIACVELHTFSSLNKQFLPHYKHTLKRANCKIVFINPKAITSRRLAPISKEELLAAFGDKGIIYINSRQELIDTVHEHQKGNDVMLMMSSGNFDGLQWEQLLSIEPQTRIS